MANKKSKNNIIAKSKSKSTIKNNILVFIILLLILALAASLFLDVNGLLFGTDGSTDQPPRKPSILGNNYNITLPVDIDSSELIEVHFVNVGQGDSIVVRLPDGVDIIIDAGSGTSEPSVVKTKELLLNYLEALNIDHFDHMISTHPDADHINMLDDVLDEYLVKKIWINDYTHTSKVFEKVNNKITAENTEVVRFDGDGDIYTISEDAPTPRYELKIYAPGHARFSDINSMSPIITLSYAERMIILTGDAHEDTEAWFLETVGDTVDCDILKAGHHGSESSSSDNFLAKIKPEFVVISVGETNSYKHPSYLVMNKLFNLGIPTYRTNRQGNIALYIDKDGEYAFGVDKVVPIDNNRLLLNDKMIREAS